MFCLDFPGISLEESPKRSRKQPQPLELSEGRKNSRRLWEEIQERSRIRGQILPGLNFFLQGQTLAGIAQRTPRNLGGNFPDRQSFLENFSETRTD